MARVLRSRSPAGVRERSADATATIVVEVGGARVLVRAGFDLATLAAVVDVLGARGGAQ